MNGSRMAAARKLADEVAQAMTHYPYLLRTTPPRLLDIDEAFSRVPRFSIFHVPATHPAPEMD